MALSWAISMLFRLCLLAQNELLHLTGGCFGQRAKDYLLGRFKMGHVVPAERD